MAQPDHTFAAASGSKVTVRMAGDSDAPTLARLAALDSAPPPLGPTLVAEIDGEAVAALPIAGGPPVADPFRRTSAAIELLELRAAQIRGGAATSIRSYRKRLRAAVRPPRATALR